jgi:hypothetical protein
VEFPGRVYRVADHLQRKRGRIALDKKIRVEHKETMIFYLFTSTVHLGYRNRRQVVASVLPKDETGSLEGLERGGKELGLHIT